MGIMGLVNLKTNGFTIVELMVSLLIGAVMLALAMPVFTSMLQKNRIRAAENYLESSLNAAREEAIKRRASVRVCPSTDGSSCRDDSDWSAGWLLFSDSNSNSSPDAGEVIKRVASLHQYIRLQVDEAVAAHVQFNATGDAFGTAGEFRICHLNPVASSRSIRVSSAGHVETTIRTQFDCEAVDEEETA